MENHMTFSMVSLARQKVFAVLLMFLGFSLLIYMISAEDEPGALPLLLIILGSGWLIMITRNKNVLP